MDPLRPSTEEQLPHRDIEHALDERPAHPSEGFAAGRCAVPDSVREEEEERPDARPQT